MVSIDLVVCCHDGPGLGVLDDEFKWLEVDLAKWPFGDDGVDIEALRFLLVDRKVLDGSGHTSGLKSNDIGYAHLTGEEGILREAFEVAAAKGVSMKANCRSQQTTSPLRECLFT